MNDEVPGHRLAGLIDPTDGVQIRRGSLTGQYWCFLQASIPAFDSGVFDPEYLAKQGLIDGSARAGRGNTLFLTLDDHRLVLRHYRRGGLIRHISARRYAYTGLYRTRALREFFMLVRLQGLGLPAPAPYACQVVRSALSYEASLVTYCIPGLTLAERFCNSTLPDSLLRTIGVTIAEFHQCGVFHADLNAHNILIDERDRVFLIDFDRARMRRTPPGKSHTGWCQANIERLDRSLHKIALQRRAGSRSANDSFEKLVGGGIAKIRQSWLSTMQRYDTEKA